MPKMTVTLDEAELKQAIIDYVRAKTGIEVKTASISSHEHDRGMGKYFTATASEA